MAVNIGALTGGTINTLALAGGVVDPATRATMTNLASRMAASMPWLPYDPVGTFAVAMDQGQLPYPSQTVPVPPAWLNDVNRMESWKKVANSFVPITQAVLANQTAVAQQQGAMLAANVEFWNAVAKYSGADAVQKVWDDLWAALSQFKAYRDSTKLALDTSNAILTQYQGRIPANLVSNHAVLVNQYNALSNRAAAAIAPLGAAGRTAAGLGIAPLIIAGIAAATVTAIAATVWAIAHEFAAVQTQANANATAVVQARDAADQAAFNAGKLTPEQLALLRQQNVQAAVDLVNSQGAGAIGKGFQSIGSGFVFGLGGLAILGIGAYALFRYAKKKTA